MDAERLAQYAALGGLPGRYTATRHRLHERCVDQVPGDERDLQLVPANDVVDDDVVGAVVARFGRGPAPSREPPSTRSRARATGRTSWESQTRRKPRDGLDFLDITVRALTKEYLLPYCAYILSCHNI